MCNFLKYRSLYRSCDYMISCWRDLSTTIMTSFMSIYGSHYPIRFVWHCARSFWTFLTSCALEFIDNYLFSCEIRNKILSCLRQKIMLLYPCKIIKTIVCSSKTYYFKPSDNDTFFFYTKQTYFNETSSWFAVWTLKFKLGTKVIKVN